MSLNAEKATLKKFGHNIAKLRLNRHMTQEQLAEAASLDRMTIAFVEGGRRWPRLSTLQTIAEALDVSLRDLFNNL